jgi:hypothetical protein
MADAGVEQHAMDELGALMPVGRILIADLEIDADLARGLDLLASLRPLSPVSMAGRLAMVDSVAAFHNHWSPAIRAARWPLLAIWRRNGYSTK